MQFLFISGSAQRQQEKWDRRSEHHGGSYGQQLGCWKPAEAPWGCSCHTPAPVPSSPVLEHQPSSLKQKHTHTLALIKGLQTYLETQYWREKQINVAVRGEAGLIMIFSPHPWAAPDGQAATPGWV